MGISETGLIDRLLSGVRTTGKHLTVLFEIASGFTHYVAFTVTGVSHCTVITIMEWTNPMSVAKRFA